MTMWINLLNVFTHKFIKTLQHESTRLNIVFSRFCDHGRRFASVWYVTFFVTYLNGECICR